MDGQALLEQKRRQLKGVEIGRKPAAPTGWLAPLANAVQWDWRVVCSDYLEAALPELAKLIVTSPPYPEQHGCDMSVEAWLDWMEGLVLPKMYRDLHGDGALVFNANFKRSGGWYDHRLFSKWLISAENAGFHLIHIEPMLLTNAPPRGNLRSTLMAHPRSAWEPVFLLAKSADYRLNRPLTPYRPKTRRGKGRRGKGRNLHYNGGHSRLKRLAQAVDYFFASTTGGRGIPYSDGKSFPMKLPFRYIRMLSEPDDLVLDPFCGVGRTLFAARRLGRRAIGVEIRADEAQRATDWLTEKCL